jgi:subtilase family serine protease
MFLIGNDRRAVVVGGTSAAAPLWAGFMALANQQAAANGRPPVGFLNPAIYKLGGESRLAGDMHDVTTGDNKGFVALQGYDLATGWGSPAGQGLIDDLTGVANPPVFGLTPSASTLSLAPGATGGSTITVSPQNGFFGEVSLATSGLPMGVTASFSPATAVTTSRVTLTAASSAIPGTSTVTITGTSGSVTSTARLALTVAASPAFTITVQPASVSLAQLGTNTGAIAVMPVNDFNGPVALAASGLPSGVTASFSPANAAGASTLTLTASSSAAVGPATVTISGTSGGLHSAATIGLTVRAANYPTRRRAGPRTMLLSYP